MTASAMRVPDAGRLDAGPRPMSAFACEYPADGFDAAHAHDRGQLLYACAGVMSVVTVDGGFLVPPQRAVWIPANVRHEVRARGCVSLRTLFIDAKSGARLPSKCRVIEVSPLLRALILEAVRLPADCDPDGRAGLIMSLALDEIFTMRDLTLNVPMPADARLSRLCRTIFEQSSMRRTATEWGRVAGMSRHTLTRMFRRETGMSFAGWCHHVRLLSALSRLAAGRTVTEVAFDVGYQSPSAFSAMFRQAFGAPPSDYYESACRIRVPSS